MKYTVTYTIRPEIKSERVTYASSLTFEQAVEICLAGHFYHMRIIAAA